MNKHNKNDSDGISTTESIMMPHKNATYTAPKKKVTFLPGRRTGIVQANPTLSTLGYAFFFIKDERGIKYYCKVGDVVVGVIHHRSKVHFSVKRTEGATTLEAYDVEVHDDACTLSGPWTGTVTRYSRRMGRIATHKGEAFVHRCNVDRGLVKGARVTFMLCETERLEAYKVTVNPRPNNTRKKLGRSLSWRRGSVR